MARTTLLHQAEVYPGELEALRGLHQEFRNLAAAGGSLSDIHRVLSRHEADEFEARGTVPHVPQVGPLYTFPTVEDSPPHVGRVLDDGMWWLRRNFGDDEMGRSAAAEEVFHVHAREGRDVCTTGRLVVHSLNIFEPPTAEEIASVRRFYAGPLPRGRKALTRELAEYGERARRAGLMLTVSRTADLELWAGETFKD